MARTIPLFLTESTIKLKTVSSDTAVSMCVDVGHDASSSGRLASRVGVSAPSTFSAVCVVCCGCSAVGRREGGGKHVSGGKFAEVDKKRSERVVLKV